jgi:tetratricopeptide (TPR) repeat protein
MRAALAWVEGYTRLLRGDLAEASAQIDQAMDLSAQLGGIVKLTLDAGFHQGCVAALCGDLEAADRYLMALFDLVAQPALAVYACTWSATYRYTLGWLRIQQGHPDEANAIAEEMETIANPCEWPTARGARLLLRGLLTIEAGETARAEELLRAAAREQGRFADALVMGDARLLLASVLLRAGRTSAALEPLRQALHDHVRRGTPGVLLLVGPRIAVPLLRLALEQQIEQATAERLLRARRHGAPEWNGCSCSAAQ